MKAKLYERQEAEWLAKVVGVVGSEEVTHKHTNVSWAAFHADQAPQIKNKIVSQKYFWFSQKHRTHLPWSKIVFR